MPDRNHRKSRSRHGTARQQAAQEATLAREQDSREQAGLERPKLKEEKGKNPTITLQDGSVVDPMKAVCAWDLLKSFPQEEPDAFQALLAMAQGRHTDQSDPRHLEALESRNFVKEDHAIESATRAVLLNSLSTVEGKPMIGALRLHSAADKVVLEDARAQLHQDYSEETARWVSPGGGRDQLWEKIQRKRGKGPSID
jgi:hypothetical protein